MRRISWLALLLAYLPAICATAQTRQGNSLSAGFPQRDAIQRRDLLARYGGNMQSEAAVDHALDWLAAHQLADGGWSFDHSKAAACDGKCSHSGNLHTCRNAATAMALTFCRLSPRKPVGTYDEIMEMDRRFRAE